MAVVVIALAAAALKSDGGWLDGNSGGIGSFGGAASVVGSSSDCS